MKSKFALLATCIAVAVFCLSSCSKSSNNNNTTGSAQMSMRLTDDPANYDAVYIDIQQIGVTMSGSSEVLLTPGRPGVYNLLSFRNGMDTLLLNTTLPSGTIGQIRLILGNNNSVVVGGTSYALTTPSAQESGVKLNFNQTLAPSGSYTIWVDFDAGKSIVQTGSGKFILKPVIKAFSALTNGKIEGMILPTLALSTVYAINGSDTTSAIPAADGSFTIEGLQSGTYTLLVVPALSTYLSYSATLSVSFGTITNVGTITLNHI